MRDFKVGDWVKLKQEHLDYSNGTFPKVFKIAKLSPASVRRETLVFSSKERGCYEYRLEFATELEILAAKLGGE